MAKRSRDTSFSPSADKRSPSETNENSSDVESGRVTKYTLVDQITATANSTVMRCSLPPHKNALEFQSHDDYEVHYQREHTNRCSSCGKNFPSGHFLSLHIEENHNALRETLQAKGEKTYGCFVEDCDRKCSTPQKRRRHLIDKHGFPKLYNFRIVDNGIDKATSLLREGQRRRVSLSHETSQSIGHRRRASSQIQASTLMNNAPANTDASRALALLFETEPRPISTEDSLASRPPPKPAFPEENRPSTPVAAEDIGTLEKSMSALRFVPPSVVLRKSKLCRVCLRKLETFMLELEDYKPHHESYMSLRTSMILGCVICRRLYFHLQQAAAAKQLSLQEALTKPPVTIAALGMHEINIRSAVELEAADFSLAFCSNQRRVADNSTFPPFVGRDHLPTPIFSGDSWKLAGRWLTECQTGHKRCSNPAFGQEMFTPCRLLEIEGSSDDFEVRLIEQADRDKRVPYITLSYCWGQSRFYVLNSSTHPELLAGVCSARLPQLFQDFFIVVKKLGVKHVWIDSLCILQDSDDDWRAQSAQMHRIYSNGVCTIAASGSSSPEETLFSSRDPELLEPFGARMNFLFCRDMYLFVDARFWKDGVERSPLSKRAWAFQERLLSPRVLHFGKKQIFWECAELEACEIFPQGLRGVTTLGGRNSGYKPLDLHNGYFGRSVEASAKTLWGRLVEVYTHCQLTKKQDKLAALSGVAKYIQSLLGGEQYLAGLWRKELHFQLLWSVARHGQSSGGLCESEYRAPSWSWASHDVPLGEQTLSESWASAKPLITILDAKVEPVGSDVTGQVSNGFIRLTGGPLLTGHFKTHIGEKYSRILKTDPWMFCFDNPPASQTFCYLPVALRFNERAVSFWIDGLVLVQVPGEKGKYRRCGTFLLTIPNPYTTDWKLCDELRKLAKDMLQETLDYKTPTDLFEDGTNNVVCLV